MKNNSFNKLLSDKSFLRIWNVFLRSYFLLNVYIFNKFGRKVSSFNSKRLANQTARLVLDIIKNAKKL